MIFRCDFAKAGDIVSTNNRDIQMLTIRFNYLLNWHCNYLLNWH